MTRTTRARYLLPALAVGVSTVVGLAALPAGAKAPTLPKSGVEKPPSASLTETGSSLLYPMMNIWVPGYNQTYSQVTIQTASTGSGTGISDATNGTATLGASDAYLSPAQVQASPGLLNIPLAISAQDVAYNIPGVNAHLNLSGKTLSAIYQGQITSWNAAQIASANPGVNLPNIPIVTMHRSDSSGDTFLFTQYLSKADPNGWGTKIQFNTTVQWPNAPGALAQNGNSGMVSGCKATPGCIAYVGISYQTQMLQAGLQYAALQNGKGQYQLPTATTIAAEAAGFTKQTPANGTISLIYGPIKGGYPIVNYEYGIVQTHQPDTNTATALRSFLEWIVNAKFGNSAQYVSQVAFQPLPPKVIAQSQKQILSVQ